MTGPEPYRDYLSGEPDDQSADDADAGPYLPDGVDRIIIQPTEPGTWVALWERGGLDAPVAETAGDRSSVISWARARTSNILIFDLDAKDLAPLAPGDL